MSEAKRLQNEQQFLVSECKRHIESNKLSLWGFKAELNTLALQYKKLKQNLENQEKLFFNVQKELTGYSREMKMIEDSLGKCTFEVLLETITPYPLIQDISTAICIQIGSQSPSWRCFRVSFN
jgi:septation ring formation regulator EzrA